MSRSLLDVLRTVTLDPGEQAAFMADRAGYLAQYGFEDVPDDALAEAFSLVADTLPADVAQTVAPAAGEGFGSFGAAESGIADDTGTAALPDAEDGLVGEPSVEADPDQTSFGEVNNDFDDVDDVADAVPDDGSGGPPGNGGTGENGAFGFGEGSEGDAVDDADFGGLDHGAEAVDQAADELAGVDDAIDDGLADADGVAALDDGLALDDAGVDDFGDDGDFGTGDADDGDLDLDDGLDLGDPGDIDDIGAF